MNANKRESQGNLSDASPTKQTFLTDQKAAAKAGGAAGDKHLDDVHARKRQEQALMFEKYLEESGLSLSFQIIFTELIQKQIAEDQVFAYTAMRLRQIGKELESLEAKQSKLAGGAGGAH